MKTNPSARGIKRLQAALFCLAFFAVAGIDFRLAQSLTTELGQLTASVSESPQPPNVSISDLMVIAH